MKIADPVLLSLFMIDNEKVQHLQIKYLIMLKFAVIHFKTTMYGHQKFLKFGCLFPLHKIPYIN